MSKNRGLSDRPTDRKTSDAMDAIGRTARGRRVKAQKDGWGAKKEQPMHGKGGPWGKR